MTDENQNGKIKLNGYMSIADDILSSTNGISTSSNGHAKIEESKKVLAESIFNEFAKSKKLELYYKNNDGVIDEHVIVPKENQMDTYAFRKYVYRFSPNLPKYDSETQKVLPDSKDIVFSHKVIKYNDASARIVFIPNEMIFKHLHEKGVDSYSRIDKRDYDRINLAVRQDKGIAYK